MEKARYKFSIIIIIIRVETNERTVTGRSKRWPPPLNSDGRLTEVLIPHSFLQLVQDLGYWPLNRWLLYGGLTIKLKEIWRS